MSRRALRRLRGEQRGQEGPGLGQLGIDPGPERAREAGPPPPPGSRPRATISNRFELIPAEESEDEPVTGEEQVDTRLSEQDTAGGNKEGNKERNKERNKEGAVAEDTDDGQREGEEAEQLDQMPASSNKPRKKKKKRKTKKTSAGDTAEDNDLEDIDSLLERLEDPSGLSLPSQGGLITDSRPLLYVEHRNLNPENELKRYFGARAVLGDQRPRQRQRQYIRSTWLTTPKNTWPRYSKTGIAMRLLDTRRGVQHFTFEHHREYQQVQFKFLDAVESMDPNNIVLLLQMNPYHVDSLLQLSDVCRMQEDQEMARDLIERALYSLECAFHPVFSLTSGTCRLDYRRPENRAFFLALFKHLMFLEKRGCPRTALEFCKLILSLDPENDPLCVLLLIDFLSLRAREYTFLTRLFQEWESHRNLSQLPNFAFSVPLAYFFLSQQEERPELERSQARERAARLIQLALVMFPSVLMPLLDHCSVQPDARVASHPFFGLNAQISQSPALNQLTSLYVGRTHALWKDPAVMAWLEPQTHEVLRMVEARDPLVQEAEHKRKIRYQSAPRNIYRHVILSEMKEATAALPLEVTSQPVMGFDPLPPLDSIVSYTRPERTSHPSNESTLSLFFRSLLPNFNLQGDIRHDGDDEAGAGQDLNQGVNRLMAAMRDMLANIQFQEPPRDDNPEGDGDWD
ncbi:transcription factor 25 isoform X1 [Chiroxiphia lanceolata]|uniref:transcription factor 25 isoform X1 n=2 Tax=Chiroxiphia lanceolata TaxID=296741 RepID=UPI0013CE85DD|nr:transcription factor 25 isoform X1 [Chiroxiphia lanceolata]